MKNLLYIIMAAMLIHSCSRYDDTWVKDELAEYKNTLSRIEATCQTINHNIIALEDILTALQKNDFIRSVTAIDENGNIKGYEFIFRDKGAVRLYFGEDGSDGKDGEDVQNPPLISVKQDTDGNWHWTIDGKWCTDNAGNKVPAISNDDVTPAIRIEEGYWFMSIDNGKTWEMLGIAKGGDGDIMFSDVSFDESFFYLTLADSSVIRIPKASDLSFELGKITSKIEPESTYTIDYKVTGGIGKVEISCIGEHGWSAKVVPATDKEGKINIKSPEKLTAGKIIFLISDDDVSLMKALIFEGDRPEAHLLASKYDYYELDGTGGYIDVIITTDQEYDIIIPEISKSWISHIDTRSVREDRIRFGIAANPPGMPARESSITLKGLYDSLNVFVHQKASPFIDSEVEMGPLDGFDDPENGITILQQATKGNGTDIVLMGDGFSKRHFLAGGKYEAIMRQAYDDFFSVEPYASLKEYFNVYYINVVSEDDHDAEPYYDYYGNQNGAVQGQANTRLGTRFIAGSTSITGNNSLALEYATHAIEHKGGTDGGRCSYSDAYNRAHKALIIVMSNVECYAGTCMLSWRASKTIDYADLYSIAYCSLGSDDTGRECKYTLIHEAGGHGFGKLADEYSNRRLTEFNTYEWYLLRDYHDYGVYRNVNEYWTYEDSTSWSGLDWEFTTEDNVYWAELFNDSYHYTSTECIGIYEGAYTYTNLFCRSTSNSLMNEQMASNGQFFNAISRWAIWYRVMKLTMSISADNFKSSLNEFIEFDKNLTIIQNNAVNNTYSGNETFEEYRPLGAPVLIEYE